MVFINIIRWCNRQEDPVPSSWPIPADRGRDFIAVMYAAGQLSACRSFFICPESRAGICRAMLLFGNIGFIGSPGDLQCFSGKWDSVRFCIYGLIDQLHAVDAGCEADISDG